MPKLAALALAGLVGVNELVLRSFTPPVPAPDSMRLDYDDAVEGVGLMSLGMRRLAADLAFIRLLMYYGSPEQHEEVGEPPHGPGDGHEHGPADGHAYGGLEASREGEHGQILPRTIRILDLDPFFSYAAIYSAGALAFNLRRPDEALAVLRHAVARDPRNWKYHAYVAAVGFSKKGDVDAARSQLEPIARDPQCPTMLKHMLAFMNARLGRREDAIRLYREVLRSRDKDYHHLARQALERLGAPVED